MNLAILKHFECSDNDIKVYTSLLQIGRSKTGPVIQNTDIASSRVYESLRRLVGKGLVSYQVKNNIKYYKAELPDELLSSYEQHANSLRSLSKEIEELPIKKTDRNETNTYEGLHGFKRAFAQHVEAIEPGEEIKIIAFSNSTVTKTNFTRTRKMFSEIDKVTFKKTKKVRILLEQSLYPVLAKEREYYKSYITRHLPPGYFSPTAVNISDREVMLSVWGTKPIVFTMRNPVVVESFKKNFEFLWNLAKKK